MDDSSVKRLGLILTIQAEIDGMKAENEFNKVINNNILYGEDAFIQKAEEIRRIVYMHPDQF